MTYHGIFHWPDKPKKIDNQLIIDAEWEETNPKQRKIDIYV
tara:strand:+ start:368 stop:490 length:123 start_codon:yes stop_codon:yes gene_type:complete